MDIDGILFMVEANEFTDLHCGPMSLNIQNSHHLEKVESENLLDICIFALIKSADISLPNADSVPSHKNMHCHQSIIFTHDGKGTNISEQ